MTVDPDMRRATAAMQFLAWAKNKEGIVLSRATPEGRVGLPPSDVLSLLGKWLEDPDTCAAGTRKAGP